MAAQNPDLAPADLHHSDKALGGYHLVAWVALEVEEDKCRRCQYDRYADVQRIKDEDGTAYARPKGKEWLRSDDWGKTGRPLPAEKAQELGNAAYVAESVFMKAEPHDQSQGGTVWRLVEKTRRQGDELFTYERSRERPHPDGVYPRYTFRKHAGDKDGELTLESYTGQFHMGDRLIPATVRYDYLLPLPSGTKIEIVTPPPAKKTI